MMFINSPLKEIMELLANGEFPGPWVATGPKAVWELNATGELVQKSLVGSKQPGTGAIFTQKGPLGFPVQALKLVCRPGSQYKVGVVFNLVDHKNFCAFCIDQHGRRARGYDLVIFEVEDGDYTVISKEAYTITQPGIATFSLQQMGTDLHFFFNEALAYTWAETSFFGKKVGLYSYKNNDAAFISLSVSPLSTDPALMGGQSMEIQPVKSNGNVVSEPAPPVILIDPQPVEARSAITGFLGIQKPASKTEIEFTEVFTVPLDSFYASLYQDSRLNEPIPAPSARASEVQLLDLRARRWYRELKAVRDDLKAALSDLARKQLRATQAEAQLTSSLDDETYSQLESKLLEKRADVRDSLNRINSLRDREGLVLREIRVSGYTVHEKTDIDAVKALGYDFHLIGPAIKPATYQPVELDPKLYLSDTVWAVEEQKLADKLFAPGIITQKGGELYKQEKALLVNFGACPTLVENKQQLEADIKGCQDLKTVYTKTVSDLELVISDWNKDKQTLSSQKQPYMEAAQIAGFTAPTYAYAPKDNWGLTHQAALSGVGWLQLAGTEVGTSPTPYPAHPQFLIDFPPTAGGPSGRYRLKRFVADVYFSTENNSFIKTALAFQCPTESGASISFYHHAVATYSSESKKLTQIKLKPGSAPLSISKLISTNIYHNSSQDLQAFFDRALKVCDYIIGLRTKTRDATKSDLGKLETELALHQAMLEDLTKNGLAKERRKFLDKWNDPATNLTSAIATRPHYPDEDPLTEFLSALSGTEGDSPVETHFFAPTPDGFYNQNGLSLLDFLQSRSATAPDVICVFPVFDARGDTSNEVLRIVRNPQRSPKKAALPTIKFVESYRVEVGWTGYGLGELSHSFNLFPGETKELVVEKSTKLSTKLSETRSSEESTSTQISSSFEDNLQNEFSSAEKASWESSDTAKQDTSLTTLTEDKLTLDETSTLELKSKLSTKVDILGSGVKMSGSVKSNTTDKTRASNKRKEALTVGQTREAKRASNQSKDTLTKNVSNSVSKVASETSRNNKLSFSAVSSREYEESTSNREVIKLQNPNVGRTVNYNFFQVQNLFGISVKLVDVQIVIDSGVELVKSAHVNDVRVYELEEFGKIYANAEQTNRAAALAAIIARQVMKHYGDFAPGVTSGNGAISVKDGFSVNKEMAEVLNFSGKDLTTVLDLSSEASKDLTTILDISSEASEKVQSEDSQESLRKRMDRIKLALNYFKGVPFQFRETVLSKETIVAVNCAAYHVETQLGFLPATETYLETRREIETEKQRAQVEDLRAKTRAGIFFPELPTGVNTVNLPAPTADKQKENPA